jgi:hypothetical protein
MQFITAGFPPGGAIQHPHRANCPPLADLQILSLGNNSSASMVDFIFRYSIISARRSPLLLIPDFVPNGPSVHFT